MTPDDALLDEAHWFERALQVMPPRDTTPDTLLFRLQSYKPKLSLTQYACPKCWLRESKRVALRPLAGSDDYDLLKCNDADCETEFVIPF